MLYTLKKKKSGTLVLFNCTAPANRKGLYILTLDKRGDAAAPTTFETDEDTPVSLTGTIVVNPLSIAGETIFECEASDKTTVIDNNGSQYDKWVQPVKVIEDKRAAGSTVVILTYDGEQYVRSLKVAGTVGSYTLDGETISPDVLEAELEGETIYLLSFTNYIKDDNESVYYKLVGRTPKRGYHG